MVKGSGANTLLNTTVSAIKGRKGKYILQASTNGAIANIEEAFDTVVLAAPLQFSGIDLQKDLLKRRPDEIPYVTLHVTLFASPLRLSAAYFKLEEGAKVPTSVFTTLSPNEDPNDRQNIVGKNNFFSFSTLKTVTNPKSMKKEYIYKIFSPEIVTPELLGSLLGIQRTCLTRPIYLLDTNVFSQCPPISLPANGYLGIILMSGAPILMSFLV
jgi:prenylcysteine oxidase / farnesylcysteine lyase